MRHLRAFGLPVAAVLAVVLVLLFGTTATANPGITPAVDPAPILPAGSTMERIRESGVLRIGTRYDHPTLSAANLRGEQEGFQIDMGEYLAGRLGMSADQIRYVEATPANREQFLRQDVVDVVIAAYVINDNRKKLVSFAGPYMQAQLDLLVLKDNPDGIVDPQTPAGERICTTSGSGLDVLLHDEYPAAQVVVFDVASKCVEALKNGSVDAHITYGPMGAGYVSKDPDQVEMLDSDMGRQSWGIGITKGDVEFCRWIDQQLESFYASGEYEAAWDASVGRYTDVPPTLPTQDPCT